MSNIDKHAVQAVADLKAGYTLGHADVAILNELARIALASLEAEAVAYMYKDNLHADARFSLHTRFGNWSQEDINEYEITEIPLYTAPPAPVAMKDHQIRDLVNELRDIAVEYYGTQQLRERIAKTVRAAMLQGAGPATTANKLRDAVETIRSSGIAIDAEKILAERDALNSPVVPDGWVMVPVEPTMSQEFAGYRTLTDTGKMSRLMKTRLSNIYRAMIAAAPQQEVNP